MRSRLLFLFLTCCLAGPLPAQTADDVTATERRLETLREQIADDERLLSETAQAEQATLATLKELDRELAVRGELSSTYERRLDELAAAGDSLRAVMASFETDLTDLRTQYKQYASHAYKYGRLHDLALILSASSINQMLIRVRYLNRFADQRQSKLDAIRRATEALEARRAKLAESRVQTQLLLREAEEEKRKMERLQQSRKQVISDLRNQRTSLEADLRQKREAASALEARVRELTAAAAAKRRERTSSPEADIAFAELSGSFMQNQGRLPWPSQGVVVEPFGDLVNPVHGTRTPNPGVFIATKPQAEVRAVFSGEVLSVSVLPEFGRFIAVQHGEYQTVYSNFSMIYVDEGAQVEAGQILGRAGTEAEPKQEGVFFALFKNGTAMNPADWLRTP